MATVYIFLTLIVTQINVVFNIPRPVNNHIISANEYSYEMSNQNQDHKRNQSPLQNRMAKNLIQFGVPINQLYVPTNLQVIPLQTNYYQEVNNQNSSVTHSSQTPQLIPVYAYIPLQYNHWVPVQELTVIPISKRDSMQGRFRSQDAEDNGRYRRVYGGHGNGWSYGGFGAGHGYHVVYHQYYK